MVGLIADIGGTNVRFALVDQDGQWQQVQALRCADFAGPEQAARHYLSQVQPAVMPDCAAFAVASAITGDQVDLTNSAWHFSIAGVQQALRLRRLQVVNDFTAVALSVPHLQDGDRLPSGGGGMAVQEAPVAVLGPGTGLGVSALVPDGRGGWQALATEGGHVTLAAQSEPEFQVLACLQRRFGHVSAERVLSGPGLVNLYQALAGLAGQPIVHERADAVTGQALDGSCPLCVQAVRMFCVWLGSVAGNLALTLGARGGVYLAGGILPRMVPLWQQSDFRAAFEAKGRFQPYLAQIPVWLIVHPQPAFAGLAGLVRADAT